MIVFLPTWITVGILELIHEKNLDLMGIDEFIRLPTNAGYPNHIGLVLVWALALQFIGGQNMVTHDNLSNRSDIYVGDDTYKFLPYQLSMVRYWLTMVSTGNGELGFDSGEGA